MILDTLTKERDHEGLIQNTYYLNENGTALLSYALWETEESYNQFLQHPFTQTKNDWEQIQNFKGWMQEKGVIRRHTQFVSIYQNQILQT
jgi:DNA-binding PadR family transcriptional regulator